MEKFKQEKVIGGCWLTCCRFSRPGVLVTHNFHQNAVFPRGYHKLHLLTQQIGVSIVPLLTDQELSELGIKTVGDRAMLRKLALSPYKVIDTPSVYIAMDINSLCVE